MTVPDALELVRRICLSFPSVEERLSHGHPAWFVGGKRQFASFHDGHHDETRPHMWCAAPAGAQEALVSDRPDSFFRPPYVGHRGWLGVYLDAGVSTSEIEGLLIESFRAVSPKRLLRKFDEAAPSGPADEQGTAD